METGFLWEAWRCWSRYSFVRSYGQTGSQSDQPRVGASVLDSADTSVKALNGSPRPGRQGPVPPEQPRRGVPQTLRVVLKPVPFLPSPFRRCWTSVRTSGPATSWSIAVFLDLTFVQEAVNTSWSPLNANLVSNCQGGQSVWGCGLPVSFIA